MSDQYEITWENIVAAAKALDVEPCAMKAVCAVESAGSGFLPSGKAKILFEGHIFWKELKKRGVDPAPLACDHPNVLYQKWTKVYYQGGEKEHARLEEAKTLHEEAALASASWGAFQIMGFNYRQCNYGSVKEFVDAQCRDATAQLEAFCGFITTARLVQHLKNKDWAAFARGYNGPAYAQNKYDQKLLAAYNKCCLEKSDRA